MFNNFYPYYQSFTGYRITPVAKIEEANIAFPDLQGNPMFFFDQSRNEFYVKQRKPQTGEVETLKYTLSKEPVILNNVSKDTNSYDAQIKALQEAIEQLNEVVGVKVKKAVKDDE